MPEIICFRKRILLEGLLRLIPAIRKRQDAELKEAITKLLKDPSLPCKIEGTIIPDGYGNHETQR